MAIPVRAKNYGSPVWKIFSQDKPTTCPECSTKHSLRYIGMDTKYSAVMSAKLYCCESCDGWVDLVWSRRGVAMLNPTPEQAQAEPNSDIRKTITVQVVAGV